MGGGSSGESERWGEGMVGGGSGGGRKRKDKSTHQVHTLSELLVSYCLKTVTTCKKLCKKL